MARKKVQAEEQSLSGRLGEFGGAVMQIADEKGISKEKVFEIIEAALAAAYKKDYGKRGQNIRAEFDEVTKSAKFFLVKEVVDETTREFVSEEENPEEVVGEKEIEREFSQEEQAERLPRFNPERDIVLEEAKKIKKDAQLGDVIETELESKEDYGRVAAQTAKQVIIQRIREAERDSMFSEYKEKEGEVINGTIQRIEGRNVFVDIGKSTGVLFPSGQIRSERYGIGQRIKVFLEKVESDPKGPGITLSRTHSEMLRKLFEIEVPEVFSKTVEIKSIAREAGYRSKIAVASNDENIDPIGSCVGQKGTRVQAVIEELGGEKIDIIMWSDNVEKFISAALSPAKVFSVELDEENHEAIVRVPEDQLSLAIGGQGQNVRLAAKLTGWKLDVLGEKIDNKETEKKEEKEIAEQAEEVEAETEATEENQE